MEYARQVRTEAALDSVDTFLEKIRTEIAADQRPEVLDELLAAVISEIDFIRINIIETLKIDFPLAN